MNICIAIAEIDASVVDEELIEFCLGEPRELARRIRKVFVDASLIEGWRSRNRGIVSPGFLGRPSTLRKPDRRLLQLGQELAAQKLGDHFPRFSSGDLPPFGSPTETNTEGPHFVPYQPFDANARLRLKGSVAHASDEVAGSEGPGERRDDPVSIGAGEI